jgi:hypothetical protein
MMKRNWLGSSNRSCLVGSTELAGFFKQNLLGWFNRTCCVVQTEPAWLVQQNLLGCSNRTCLVGSTEVYNLLYKLFKFQTFPATFGSYETNINL